MKYFQHTDGRVFAFELDGSQDHLITADMRPMTQAEVDAHLAPIVVTPTSVTMRQARLALLSAGKLAQVNAAIAAIPDATQRAAAEIEWEYAQTVDRGSPFVQMLGTALALDLDALFTLAAQQ